MTQSFRGSEEEILLGPDIKNNGQKFLFRHPMHGKSLTNIPGTFILNERTHLGVYLLINWFPADASPLSASHFTASRAAAPGPPRRPAPREGRSRPRHRRQPAATPVLRHRPLRDTQAASRPQADDDPSFQGSTEPSRCHEFARSWRPEEEQPTPSIDRRGSLGLLTSALTGVGNTDCIYITLAQQVMI